MALSPVPHSAEWFEALEAVNPQQALITKTLIEAAGSPDVCSICGDEEQTDYIVDEPNLPPDAVATIRLCEDCKIIQGGNFRAVTP